MKVKNSFMKIMAPRGRNSKAAQMKMKFAKLAINFSYGFHSLSIFLIFGNSKHFTYEFFAEPMSFLSFE
jgi:hypothetical protein